ncbi:MAG: hypothetical protein MMC23_002359 [Stictis urceolatum]|nr:hypothetical protein [Stictis urceolata]
MLLSCLAFLAVGYLSYGYSFAAVAPHSPFSWSSTEALLAFGDSYTYVQGSRGRQNYSFIGDNLAPDYSPAQLLSDRIVSGQSSTAEGGPNWVEYLTGCYEGLPEDCSGHAKEDKQLWDFAFAGADISVRALPRHHNYTVMLDEQIERYSVQARPYLQVDSKKTLVAVWIGINDISDSATNSSISDHKEFYTYLQSLMFASLEPLTHRSSHSSAFRNFLFMSLPPLEVSPVNIQRIAKNETLLPNAVQVEIWNMLMAKAVAKWSRDNGVHGMLFDSHMALTLILDNADKYGIRNTTGYCPHYDAPDIATQYESYGCLPIEQYFWYNSGHLTYHTHRVLADMVGQFLEENSA